MSRFPFLGSGSSIPGNDAFTKILMHFDNNLSDVNAGGSAHSWTNVGTSFTTNSKFGTHALDCGAGAGYITTPDSVDFTLGTGSWTVDFWCNVQGGAGTPRQIFGQVNSTGSPGSIFGAILNTNVFQVVAFISGVAGPPLNVDGVSTVTTGVWHHYAGVRSGNNMLLFLDGVLQNTVAIVPAGQPVVDDNTLWGIGRIGENVAPSWNGFIDEFRLSVGIARWTANFTPPTAPYG
jgi:hypothetical protein